MEKVKFRCEGCGYVHDGDTSPSRCPKCGAASEKMVALDEQAAELVERSRRANALHCRIVSLAREIEAACKDGIEDSLDPGCLDVFQKTLACSYVTMKLSMTEMKGHAAKGKWG